MTREEYQKKTDDLSIELGELQAKKDRIKKSSLDADEMKRALSALDRKMDAVRIERFRIDDEYNYEQEQRKIEFDDNRNELVLQTNIDMRGKREKYINEYIKKFPHSELTKDILLVDKEIKAGKVPSKRIDLKKIIAALKEAKEIESRDVQSDESEDVRNNDNVSDTDTAEESVNEENQVVNDDTEENENDSVVDKISDKYGVSPETLVEAAKLKASRSLENSDNEESKEDFKEEVAKMTTDDGKGRQKVKGIGVASSLLQKALFTKAGRTALIAAAGVAAIALLIINAPVALGAAAVALAGKEINTGRKGK